MALTFDSADSLGGRPQKLKTLDDDRKSANPSTFVPANLGKKKTKKMMGQILQRLEELELKQIRGTMNRDDQDDCVFSVTDASGRTPSETVNTPTYTCEPDADDLEVAAVNQFLGKLEKLDDMAEEVCDSFKALSVDNQRKLDYSMDPWSTNVLSSRLDDIAREFSYIKNSCVAKAKTTRVQELKELLDVNCIEPILGKIHDGVKFDDLVCELLNRQVDIPRMLKKVYAHAGKPVVDTPTLPKPTGDLKSGLRIQPGRLRRPETSVERSMCSGALGPGDAKLRSKGNEHDKVRSYEPAVPTWGLLAEARSDDIVRGSTEHAERLSPYCEEDLCDDCKVSGCGCVCHSAAGLST